MSKYTISDQIRTLRKNKGLSQEALAELAGINLRTLQRIESGSSIPRGETLRLLAEALDVPVETLSGPAAEAAPMEDTGVLKLLNLSALSFWFIPFGNVLFPLALWLYKRETVAHVRELGIRILSYQIAWTVLVYGTAFAAMFFGLSGMLGNPMFPLYAISAMMILNTAVIIWMHFKINRGEEAWEGWTLFEARFKFMRQQPE